MAPFEAISTNQDDSRQRPAVGVTKGCRRLRSSQVRASRVSSHDVGNAVADCVPSPTHNTRTCRDSLSTRASEV
eukprot:7159557-Prymnesium_polylepis.1